MRLQVGLTVNTDKDPEPEVRVTPVDILVPAGKEIEVQLALGVLNGLMESAGLHDPTPNDGELNTPETRVRIPINILFLHTNVDAKAGMFFKIKE
jgi:hypothetical protein